MDFRDFSYMTWAKAHYFDCELSLVPSGIPWPSREEFPPPDFAAGEIEPYVEVGYDDEGGLSEHVTGAYAVAKERICACLGSTQSNLHVVAALCEPGDEVLVERPAYELFACLASVFGLELRRFDRAPEQHWDLDVGRVEAALSDRTKLVVLTSVHNPSGRVASEETLRALGELCEARGIHALVSEVYLDFVDSTVVGPGGEAPTRRFASEIHPRLISTNSMTKVFGLGSVRTGWIFAQPELADRFRRLRETIAPLQPALAVAITNHALEHRHALLARARGIAERGRALLHAALDPSPSFELAPPQVGIMSLARVVGVDDTMRFSDWLREEHKVGVVPGEFFGCPGWLRLGYGQPEDKLQPALARLVEVTPSFPG